MKRRFTLLALLVSVASLAVAATAVGGSTQTPVTGKVAVLGPYGGADEASFQAVLDGFEQRNPQANVTFTSGGATTGTTLADLVARRAQLPDVALLTLPSDAGVMRDLVKAGALTSLGFAEKALDESYAFAWKRIGLVDGRLYGLPFKATERSAFWYDPRLFARAGVEAPRTWRALERVTGRLLQAGIKPFAIPAADGQALTDVFESVYLGQQGQSRYERLAAHRIKWTDPSVKSALRATRGVIANPFFMPGGMRSALATDVKGAVSQVFGARPRAAMVFGGSAVLPVHSTMPNMRPLSQFGTFAFPAIGKPPARVIGHADAVVMLEDTPAARALVQYLATPEAASIWAKRGAFLSPNRKVDPNTYPTEPSRELAEALTKANAFRLDLSEQQPAAFRTRLGELVREFVRRPAALDRVTTQLEAAASRAFELS